MTSRFDLGVQLVTDDRLPFPLLKEVVAAAIAGGVRTIQLRDKRISARELIAQAQALSDVIDARAQLIINDRIDIAWAARSSGARISGVHLGQNDVAPEMARRLLGPAVIIGWSAHHPSHLDALARFPPESVDYLGVGSIRATGTKPDHPPELGVEGFAKLAAVAPLPCVAIGGVTVDDVSALRAAGAAGVAVVSAITGAVDPGASARALVQAAESALPAQWKVSS